MTPRFLLARGPQNGPLPLCAVAAKLPFAMLIPPIATAVILLPVMLVLSLPLSIWWWPFALWVACRTVIYVAALGIAFSMVGTPVIGLLALYTRAGPVIAFLLGCVMGSAVAIALPLGANSVGVEILQGWRTDLQIFARAITPFWSAWAMYLLRN